MGAVARFSVGLVFAASDTPGFHWATWICNVTGSLAMGILLGMGMSRDPGGLWFLTGVGFLGAFTTYSAFAGDTMGWIEQQQYGWAFANVALNVFGSLVACAGGFAVFRALSGTH